ncbi:unnamed protein product [Diabrotica balteata]|uniref:Uncharacterized protein n=1 Tax=Diabrotica balteata TaxID=107213 RepID=A0A9N9XJ19_DIABA|nr:unnamed protein product [Diabrotica balteata]
MKKLVETQIKEAKEHWMVENCREIEELNLKYDTYGLHKKLKETTGNNRKRIPQVIR